MGVFILLTMVAAFLAYNNVQKNVTAEDTLYITEIFTHHGLNIDEYRLKNTFGEQINSILAVQKTALETAPANGLIPLRTPREPRNFYESHAAYCGDRSRYMDKALQHLGFKTRFVTIMRDNPDQTMLQTLLKRGGDDVRSHALVEVLTDKGWLVVDSRRQWISLAQDGQPVSLHDIQKNSLAHYTWDSQSASQEPWFLLAENFYIFYGLYSRHGLFYPPYIPYVPDINWPEFIQNF